MGTTKSSQSALPPFFETLATEKGVRRAWEEFRSAEQIGNWGVVTFSEGKDALVTLYRPDSDKGEWSTRTLTFFGWLSRRAREQAGRAVVEFENSIGACQTVEEEQALVERYVEEAERLKGQSRAVKEDVAYQVLATWLQRVSDDVKDLASDASSRRERRGGQRFDESADQEGLVEQVDRLLRDSDYWHPQGGRRSGPNVSKIRKAIEADLEAVELLGDLDSRRAEDRIRRAVLSLQTRRGVGTTRPPEEGSEGGEIDWT